MLYFGLLAVFEAGGKCRLDSRHVCRRIGVKEVAPALAAARCAGKISVAAIAIAQRTTRRALPKHS